MLTMSDIVRSVKVMLRTENLPLTDEEIAYIAAEVLGDLSVEFDIIVGNEVLSTTRATQRYALSEQTKRVLAVLWQPSAVGTITDLTTDGGGNVLRLYNSFNPNQFSSNGWAHRGFFYLVNSRQKEWAYRLVVEGGVEYLELATPAPVSEFPTPPFDVKESADWVMLYPVGVQESIQVGLTNNLQEFVMPHTDSDPVWLNPEQLGFPIQSRQYRTPENFVKENLGWGVYVIDGVPNLELKFFQPKTGLNNLIVRAVRYADISGLDPMTIVVPLPTAYRQLLSVATTRRVLASFMGNEVSDWVQMLMAEERQLRNRLRTLHHEMGGFMGGRIEPMFHLG